MASDPDAGREAALKARIATLRDRFAARAGETRAAVLDASQQGDRKALRDQAHRLAGSSATFGFPEIGEAAFAVQAAVDGAASDQALAGATEQLAELLGAIATA